MKTMKNNLTLSDITNARHDEEDAAMIRALCAHLECEPSDISREKYDHYGLALYAYGRTSYAIGTDEQADAACRDYVRDSVWAFNASFILGECGLPIELEDAIRAFQEDKCEGANDALLALVEKCCEGGVPEFTASAISADGRGHFLSGYDGEENDAEGADENGEVTRFYIYRTN